MPVQKITPCLWFAEEAEAAATFYVGIFPDSRIRTVTRYGEAGQEIHGRPPGSVLTVDFDLDGQPFTALNDPDRTKADRAMAAMLRMKKPDMAELKRAYEG